VRVVWSDAALGDVELIQDYLRPFNPSAAARVAEDLVLAGDSLATFPHRGRPGMSAGTRELTIVRPYVIVYEISGEEVVILRVWHAAQDRS
jgi:toxin ParE1/3/4